MARDVDLDADQQELKRFWQSLCGDYLDDAPISGLDAAMMRFAFNMMAAQHGQATDGLSRRSCIRRQSSQDEPQPPGFCFVTPPLESGSGGFVVFFAPKGADPMNVGESVDLVPSRVSSEDVLGGGANAPQVSISAGNQHHHSLHASDAL